MAGSFSMFTPPLMPRVEQHTRPKAGKGGEDSKLPAGGELIDMGEVIGIYVDTVMDEYGEAPLTAFALTRLGDFYRLGEDYGRGPDYTTTQITWAP